MPNIFAVVGSRNFHNYAVFCDILNNYQFSKIVSGGATGVDSLAARYAQERNIPILEIKPDYGSHPGRIAPIIRNKEIVNISDCVIVLWDGESPGTRFTLNYAFKSGKPVFLYNISLFP